MKGDTLGDLDGRDVDGERLGEAEGLTDGEAEGDFEGSVVGVFD